MTSLSPDPTLKVGNLIRAMEKATVGMRRGVWEKMLSREVVEEIYNSHSSEEEKLHFCADTYVTCAPKVSWEEIVQELYSHGAMAAAKIAKAFLQQKGGYNGTSVIHTPLELYIIQQPRLLECPHFIGSKLGKGCSHVHVREY